MDNQRLSLGLICFAIFFMSVSSADDFFIRQVTDAVYNNSTNLKTNLGFLDSLRYLKKIYREPEPNTLLNTFHFGQQGTYSPYKLHLKGVDTGRILKVSGALINALPAEVDTSDTLLRVTSVLRDERPSSQILTIESFSVVKNRGEAYESSVFEAIGYQWTLVLYVRGKRDDGGADHVSLYVKIKPTDDMSSGWEVNVDLKLFVHNKKLNKYLTVTDGTTKKYNDKQRELGYGQLIPLSTFYDTNEGYIVEDTCSFGAELVKPIEQQQKVTIISYPPHNIFTWNILHFSNLENKFYYSDAFLIGDRYWKLGFNPKGLGSKPNGIPLYLYGQDFKPNALVTSTWAHAYLRVKNQLNSNHKQLTTAAWYPVWKGKAVGVRTLLSFKDLYDATKGYLVNDVIILEVEMLKVSVTNIVPI